MPNSTEFGDDTESGQVIPLRFGAVQGNYTHAMYVYGFPTIAGGRKIWGFPKKLLSPRLRVCSDTLVGELDYRPVRVATMTMGYKYQTLNAEAVRTNLAATPNFLLKIIPPVDGSVRICELVRYHLEEVRVQGPGQILRPWPSLPKPWCPWRIANNSVDGDQSGHHLLVGG